MPRRDPKPAAIHHDPASPGAFGLPTHHPIFGSGWAPARATLSRTTFSHGRAADDLNHNLFRLVLANRVCGGSSSASRPFVLAALRALHLDPDCRSTAIRHMAGTRSNNEND